MSFCKHPCFSAKIQVFLQNPGFSAKNHDLMQEIQVFFLRNPVLRNFRTLIQDRGGGVCLGTFTQCFTLAGRPPGSESFFLVLGFEPLARKFLAGFGRPGAGKFLLRKFLVNVLRCRRVWNLLYNLDV